jgi:actin-related protein
MKTCPKCKYKRTVQDDLLFPDYECPSCGIIFEKDKARQELAELEKQRENERKAKLERLKKEEERKRKEEQERLLREEQNRKREIETERRQILEAERARQEEEERKRREKEELLQKEADEKLRQKLDDEKKQAEEATKLLQQRQQKIEQIAQENPDKIISSTETEQTYQLFDMCPFNMAQTGKGLSIVGFGETKNKWQHARCMQKYCRLWTWKTDDTGAVYGQGCSLQFLGLNKGEIEKNFLLKNRQILEDTYPPPDPNNIPDNQK